MQKINYFSLFLVATLLTAPLCVKASLEAEYTRKAEIIKQLIQIITWPKEAIPQQTLNVCVMGEPPHLKSIEPLEGMKIHQHTLHVKKIDDTNLSNKACQVIYITDSKSTHSQQLIEKFYSQPVLLIGDMEKFAAQGGNINFTHLNQVLAVTINLESVKQSHLSINLRKWNRVTIIPERKDLLHNQ